MPKFDNMAGTFQRAFLTMLQAAIASRVKRQARILAFPSLK
jgi:hypothetical protein